MEVRTNLVEVKDRLRRWLAGEWMGSIYPHTTTHGEAVAAWRADLLVLAGNPWCPACRCECGVLLGTCTGCGEPVEYR